MHSDDRESRPPIDDGMDRRDLNLIFSARHVVIVAFQIMSYLGRASSPPWWEPLVDFALVVPYSVFTHARSLRLGRIPGWVPLVDTAILVGWLIARPTSTPALVAMMVATLTIAGQSVARRWLWSAFAMSVAGMYGGAVLARSGTIALDATRYLFLGACVLATVTLVRTKRIEAQRRLQHGAHHDALTGLANRALIGARVDEHPVGSLAVLLADLNNFKEVNDALGHHVGDELLVAVSRRICDVAPDGATVGRLGGDEFAIVLPGCSRSTAIETADRITGALRRPFLVDGLTIEVGASIGIALRCGNTDPLAVHLPGGCKVACRQDADMLLRHADVAMYQAKHAGRPFRLYDPADDHTSVRRVTLLGELRTAIAEDQLEVWYQPALHVGSGRLNCMEALVRWRHPQHGLLLPGEFIELAEISGAIDELTQWVIERSVRDVQRLGDLGHDLLVSCNLSVRNLHDRVLLDWLEQLAGDVGLPTSGLYLELTESQIMEDPGGAAKVLRRLSEMGIGAAVDDFGTGYSSLSMLLTVRASVLKIDRSFVADLFASAEARVMVRSIIDLGHNLGMIVVAEGVEDEVTLQELSRLGCDVIQGFHVARPMPFDQLVGFLGAPVELELTGRAVG